MYVRGPQYERHHFSPLSSWPAVPLFVELVPGQGSWKYFRPIIFKIIRATEPFWLIIHVCINFEFLRLKEVAAFCAPADARLGGSGTQERKENTQNTLHVALFCIPRLQALEKKPRGPRKQAQENKTKTQQRQNTSFRCSGYLEATGSQNGAVEVRES